MTGRGRPCSWSTCHPCLDALHGTIPEPVAAASEPHQRTCLWQQGRAGPAPTHLTLTLTSLTFLNTFHSL